ncbi:MAG TPA: hypothetical protein GX014_04330 [Firmicutes bacterium]|nr:hypothetical protein [Bacillota bacterium]
MEIRRGVWQVRADDALMKELDGWRSQGRLLQFTFDRGLASAYGADLIGPGSYRLNTLLNLIRRQGVLSQAHIPHHFFYEPNIRRKVVTSSSSGERAYVLTSSSLYGQYLQLELLAEARGLQKKESLHTVTVNLSSGEILKFPLPAHLIQGGGVDPALVVKRKCSLKNAYLSAAAHVAGAIAEQGQEWAQEALESMAAETEKLNAFFQGRSDSAEYEAKLQELQRRMQPVLAIDAVRGAVIYAPLFRYRLVVVDAQARERTKTVTYDPIANLHELDQ